jgi:predicted TIM-barrel fold metal-dependent hydrolase
LIKRGVRLVCMVPGPVPCLGGTRSPGAPEFDGFWSRVAEAGVTVAFHSGDAGYRVFSEAYGGTREFKAFAFDPLERCMSPEPIHDTMAALVCHGVFNRFPKLRVATIECGSEWVAPLIRQMKKTYGQMSTAFEADPVEQFREHVWVSPYYEDDLKGLASLIGSERILFGSDYPHAEGLSEPTEFIHDLEGFSQDAVRQVMQTNARSLVQAS